MVPVITPRRRHSNRNIDNLFLFMTRLDQPLAAGTVAFVSRVAPRACVACQPGVITLARRAPML